MKSWAKEAIVGMAGVVILGLASGCGKSGGAMGPSQEGGMQSAVKLTGGDGGLDVTAPVTNFTNPSANQSLVSGLVLTAAGYSTDDLTGIRAVTMSVRAVQIGMAWNGMQWQTSSQDLWFTPTNQSGLGTTLATFQTGVLAPYVSGICVMKAKAVDNAKNQETPGAMRSFYWSR